MSKEAMKLALEAAYLAGFNASGEGYNGEYPFDACVQKPEDDAVWLKDRDNALREALAEQPAQQEPYGWHTEDHLTDRSATTYSKDVADRWKSKGWPVTPLYTSPQSKSWVHATTWRGLTDEEWQEIDASLNGKRDLARIFTRAIEAKLKEKNA